MADEASIDVGESVTCEFDQPNRIWNQDERAFWIGCKKQIKVHVELIGGGGGGGGGTDPRGGTGGGAGEFSLKELILDPGDYRIIVGAPGQGGWSYGAGTPRPRATAGGDSFFAHAKTGYVYASAKGGAAGKYGGAPGQPGGDGGSVTNNLGQTISRGGAGGKHDRPGAAGTGPGAGSGGGGDFDGPSDYQNENGRPGRVIITRVA